MMGVFSVTGLLSGHGPWEDAGDTEGAESEAGSRGEREGGTDSVWKGRPWGWTRHGGWDGRLPGAFWPEHLADRCWCLSLRWEVWCGFRGLRGEVTLSEPPVLPVPSPPQILLCSPVAPWVSSNM